MGEEIYLFITLIFIILGALVAVETRSLLSSVISLGAVGFGLSIAFLLLMAPDLAIVQIAVEVILLIFLIRATIGRDVVPTTGHINWISLSIVSLLIVAFLLIGIYSFRSLLAFGTPIISAVGEAPSNSYIENGLSRTGAANIVTSVILDYRAYDTLGEATVLFTAILGALTVLRVRSRRELGGRR